VKAIESGDYPSIPQQGVEEIKHAPKIFKETCEIKWDQPSKKILDFVRGLSPYPAAWMSIDGRTFKIYAASAGLINHSNISAGNYVTDNKKFLHIRTADGWLSIDELQPEGKKRMKIEEFFRGNKI
jgi:methionyl-tRNA formyltransferase